MGNWDVVCTGPGELDWDVVAGTWAVTSPYPLWLPGDANCDTVVDAADYIILKTNFGRSGDATWLQGDFNFDSDVDYADLLALMGNFGVRTLPSPGDSAPEPGTLILLTGLGVATLCHRRRQAK